MRQGCTVRTTVHKQPRYTFLMTYQLFDTCIYNIHLYALSQPTANTTADYKHVHSSLEKHNSAVLLLAGSQFANKLVCTRSKGMPQNALPQI